MEQVGTQVLQDGTVETLYKTRGTCSQYIEVAVRDGIIQRCQFFGGCQGNTVGLAKMVVGQRVEDVIHRLDGIACGMKGTSCPDQLCRALEENTSQR